jgi:hypothetical protein
MITEQDLKAAYSNVENCTMAVFDAGLKFELSKEDVEKEVLNATFKGEIQGKNEGERKAVAMQMFAKEYELMATNELVYRNLANDLSLARIHLDFVRDCIRIEELAKR